MQRRHLAVATIAAAAVLGVGGAGIAAAQTDDGSSTTVTTPDGSATTEAPADTATPTAPAAPSDESQAPATDQAPGPRGSGDGSMAGGCDHGSGEAPATPATPAAPSSDSSATSGTADASTA